LAAQIFILVKFVDLSKYDIQIITFRKFVIELFYKLYIKKKDWFVTKYSDVPQNKEKESENSYQKLKRSL